LANESDWEITLILLFLKNIQMFGLFCVGYTVYDGRYFKNIMYFRERFSCFCKY